MPSDLADLAAEAEEARQATAAGATAASSAAAASDAAVPNPRLKRQATAKVVAVVKRNWQPTAGSIDLATRRGNRVCV
jgi:hypothetical protein